MPEKNLILTRKIIRLAIFQYSGYLPKIHFEILNQALNS
ncbi:hypothetical protein A33Q_3432 [Indibacter alkaliphilus LW1]|uniref:Uncharacterized protein n=1 Tax=Indibacter alkaliphilus (strain CCUG 57479 / KCTC 22604 / LW1) TaxID=1189612 RepID=S2D7M3_INDAL|nr:hypothetical protein A33Q_3432 [Indibacter alkaliphilus LW1]